VDRLKAELKTAPVLLAVDSSKLMEVDVDSSKTGWGAVLKQVGPDELWHPCIFVSGKFNNAQSKYSATDRETLGLVEAAKTLRRFTVGNPNVLFRTDHKAVAALPTKDPGSLTEQQSRWLAKIIDRE